MDAFITALTGAGGITAASLWASVASIVPFLLIVVPFAFGYNIIRKSVKGVAKGKVKL